MTQRIVSVGDDFALPAGTKVLDTHLPTRLGTTALNATYGPEAPGIQTAIATAIANSAPDVDDIYDALDGFTLISGPDVDGDGDSLTAGAGGNGLSWPAVLQEIITGAYSKPCTVNNQGVGGETSATIVGRVGGVPWLATVAGGSIPASGPVVVTLKASDTGVAVAPLLQDGVTGGRGLNPVDIAGVRGSLSLNAGVYSFTRTAAGSAVSVPEPAEVTTQAMRDRRGNMKVMWWGTNDGTSDATTIIARQQASIRKLKAFKKRWIVLGLSNGNEASRAAMDAQFLAAFGDRFLNIRKYLSSTAVLAQAGITPTQADTDAIAVGAVPPSLLSDGLHFTAEGYRRIGRAIYEKLKALGFNDQWGTLVGDDTENAPSIYLEDTFNRADGALYSTTTPIGGKAWSGAGTGTATVESGAVALNPTGGEIFAIADAGSSNAKVKATLKAVGGTSAQLVMRYTSTAEYLILSGKILRSRVGNVNTDIATLAFTVAAGNVYEITLNGTNCIVKVNGTEYYNNPVPAMSGTKFGFAAYPTTNAQRWDDIRVSELP
jgi:lysophospholipase L1-like esterase